MGRHASCQRFNSKRKDLLAVSIMKKEKKKERKEGRKKKPKELGSKDP